jgi:predicted RNA-binding Zn-ribbon protein involved in translation (DUF1610 family)
VVKMSPQPNSVKFLCPLCGGNLEIAAENVGQFAPCPHCGEEIPLEKPAQEDFVIKSSNLAQYQQVRNRAATQAATGTTPELKQLVKVGYLLAIIMPLIGFFIGLFLLFKNRPLDGILCMVLSLIFSGIWAAVLLNFF